jgi:integrase
MGRKSAPWYRKSHKAWVCRIDSHQHTLAKGPQEKTRAEAQKEFHRLMAARGETRADPPMRVDALCDLFMDHIQADRKPATYEWYRRHLKTFLAAHGALSVAEIRPHHVLDWSNAHGWAPGTRRGAIGAVQAAFRWGKKVGHIDADPLGTIERPRAPRRTAILTTAQVEAILASVPPEFGLLLEFLRESGARLGEAARLTKADVDWERGIVILQEHKTGAKTDRPRILVLSARALAILTELTGRHPTGPLFRNSRNNAWTRQTVQQNFERVRRKLNLGPEATAHALRHRFATDALVTQPNTVVAALLGHSGTAMVDQVYSHVKEEIDVLREAIAKVRPGPKDADP